MNLKRLIALAAVVLALSCPSGLKAGDSWHGLPYFGYGFSGSLYGLGFVPVPPYYALHPPVYYGDQVTRSYGASPFACKCHHHGHKTQPATPTMIRNHNVVPLDLKAPKVEQQAALPRVIVNPYYQGQEQVVQSDK